MKNTPTYIKENEAAAYLCCAPITLAKDRCDRKLGIPFYKLGRSIRYKTSDLDAWMEKRKVVPANLSNSTGQPS